MRISVTAIDSLRYLLSTDKTLDEILADMRGEVEATDAMKAGQAFHQILEYPPSEELDVVECDGYRFEFAVEGEIALPPIRELKAELPLTVRGIPVTLVGKVDGLHGKRVDDHKLTGSFSAEKYMDAFQWRAYLHAFNGDSFRYNVFTASQIKSSDIPTYRVRHFDQLTFNRYIGIERDVMRMLTDYVDFCCDYLPEKVAA